MLLVSACVARANEPAPAALLGRSEAELREAFGDALSSEKIEARRGSGQPPAAAVAAIDPFAEQLRLVRKPQNADVRRVAYELFRGRVYRVRWQLAERFERPIMESIVAHLTADFGRPYYDQLIEGKFGSGRATLRRAAWRSETRSLEVRQLNPLVGGPLYITLSNRAAVRAIVASGKTAAPEPDSIGPWWQKPVKPSDPLTAAQRDALLTAFHPLIEQAGWGH